jgi:hypothetical protein
LLAVASVLCAQESKPPDSKPPDIPPGQLVRQTVEREVAAANDTAVKHMFRDRKQTPKGSQTRLYVETNDAMAGMLISLNDQPLNPQQKQAEHDHLTWLQNNPDQLRKKHARETEDVERTLRIVKALPDAFLYEYAGTETGSADLGKAGDQLIRLKFTPNPDYSPPSRIEQALSGMEGSLLIDADARRIARIDGTLFREVSFGWGLIGHLDQGGHFRVQQAEAGDGSWEITQMDLKVTGKILLFKSLSLVSDEVFTDFVREPDHLTFAQGVDLLLKAEEKPVQNAPTPAN